MTLGAALHDGSLLLGGRRIVFNHIINHIILSAMMMNGSGIFSLSLMEGYAHGHRSQS